jgi:hypothetical protein
MTAVLLGYVWFNYITVSEKTGQTPVASIPADPETTIDHQLQLSGTNYDEVTDAQGKMTGSFASTYVKYLAPDGTYQPIDTTVAKADSAEYPYENLTNVFQTQFSGQTGAGDKIKFAVAGGRSLSFSFADPQEAAAVVKGNTVTYANVYDGLDAKYTVQNDKLLEELILNKQAILEKVSQKMWLENVYYKQNSNGTITFHDVVTKNLVFTIEAPYMYEKNNPEKKSTGLNYTIEETDGGYVLNKVINDEGKAWLAKASFPVVIDPNLSVPKPTSVTIAPPTQARQLVLTFQDSSTGEDGWFVQASPTGLAGSWLDICQPLSGMPIIPGTSPCLDLLGRVTGNYTCSTTSTASTGNTCTVTTTAYNGVNLTDNQQLFYQVGTYGYLTFGTGGAITNSTDFMVKDVAVDGQFFYAVGKGVGDSWKIEKRWVDDGSLCSDTPGQACNGSAFDTDGMIYVDNSDNMYDIMFPSAIAVDATYIYVAGQWANCTSSSSCTNRQWRIEKRLKSTGELDTSFGTGGIVYSSLYVVGSARWPLALRDLVVDNTAIYITGDYYQTSAITYPHIEKRSITTGALCSGAGVCDGANFSANGIMDINASYSSVYAIEVDGTYIYFAVAPNGGYVQQSLKSTGAWARQYNSTPYYSCGLALDGGYLYTVGFGSASGYRLTLTRHWISSSTVLNSFTDSVNNTYTYDVGVDANYIYTFGYGAGNWRWRKFLRSTLAVCTAGACGAGQDFGIAGVESSAVVAGSPEKIAVVPNTYFLSVGSYSSGRPRIEKRRSGNGALDNVACNTYGCVPPDGWQASTPASRFTLATSLGNVAPVTDSIEYSQFRIKNVTNPGLIPPLQDFTFSWNGRSIAGGTGAHFGFYPVFLLNSNSIVTQTLDEWNNMEGTIPHVGMDMPPYLNLVGYDSTPNDFSPDTTYYSIGAYATNGDAIRTAPTAFSMETTRARNQSAPQIGAVTVNSIQVQINTDPPSSPEAINPTNTDYAICDSTSCGHYLKNNGSWTTNPADAGVWCDLYDPTDADFDGLCQWDPTPTGTNVPLSAPVTVSTKVDGSAIGPNTCLDFTTKSRNRDTPQVEGEVAGRCGNNYVCENDLDCALEDRPCTLYTPMSAVTHFCSLADQPLLDVGAVTCGYDALGYYCRVTINTANNPDGTHYFIQYSNTTSTTPNWGSGKTAMDWTAQPRNFTFTHRESGGITCDANYFYHYRVKARNFDLVETAYSATSRYDTLPPCPPSSFAHADNPVYTILRWSWQAPVGGLAVDYYKFYDFGGTQIGADIFGGLTSFTQMLDRWGGSLTPNTQYSAYLRAVDSRGREGQKTATISAFTAAKKPLIGVECKYDTTDNQNCKVTVTGLTGNPHLTKYQIQYSTNGGTSWNDYPGYDGWRTKTEPTSSGGLGLAGADGGILTFKDLSLCNTTYIFHMRAKNQDDTGACLNDLPHLNDCTSYSGGSTAQGLTPPCAPLWPVLPAPNHTTQDLSSIRWNWSPPLGLPLPTSYEIFDALTGLSLNGKVPIFTDEYLQEGLNPNSRYQVYVKASNASGAGPQSSTASAYTSIQTPASIQFLDRAEQTISLDAGEVSDYSNLLESSSGIIFEEIKNSGNYGAGSDPGFHEYRKNPKATDNGLEGNREYCYQVQSCNGDCSNPNDGTGDYSGFIPPNPGECIYTLAWAPRRPFIYTVDGTTMNLRLRSDDNPTVPVEYTQYAICVTKYNADGTVAGEKYVKSDGSIDFTTVDPVNNPDCANGYDPAPGVVAWGSRADWGGDAGVDITNLEASVKYDFKVKARNGEDSVIDSTGCVQDRSCVPTNFGSEATLFLVKNNVVGWAWSSNIGWVSFNCLNRYDQSDYSCGAANHWGLNTHFVESREFNPLEGYAWSASGQALEDEWTKSDSADLGMDQGFGVAKVGVGEIWVVLGAESGTNSRLARISKATGHELDCDDGEDHLLLPPTTPCAAFGNNLRSLAYDGTNLWVVSAGDGIIYKVDPSNGAVFPVQTGGSIAISGCDTGACNLEGIVYVEAELWVTHNVVAGEVSRIRVSDGVESARYGVGSSPTWPLFDGKYVWAPNYGSNFISRIGLDGSVNNTYNLGAGITKPYDLAFDNRYLWVARQSGLTRLDPANGNVIQITDGDWTGDDMYGLEYFHGNLWLGDAQKHSVYQIDPINQSTIKRFDFGNPSEPKQIINDGSSIWSTDYGTNFIYKISPAAEPVTTGLGWISSYESVCSNDSQKGCYTDIDCGVANTCNESAGSPPDGVTYGYCYDKDGNMYGQCSDNSAWCTTVNLTHCAVPASATCLFDYDKRYTCSRSASGGQAGTCTIDPVNDVCHTFATSNFNGTTHGIDGWARIMSLKDIGAGYNCGIAGSTQPCAWGWISWSGEYDDGQGNKGSYSTVGTSVDTQSYLGDPDLNPDEIPLYSLFGWGWNAEKNDFSTRSRWLPAVNVSNTKKVATNIYDNPGYPDIAIDSAGDPHLAWVNYNDATASYVIYYIKYKNGRWLTADDSEYQPGVNGQVAKPAGKESEDAERLSLALDGNDLPHLAWDENSIVYYSSWDSTARSWQAPSQVDTGSYMPSMEIDRNNHPHIVYRKDSYALAEIYYRWNNGTAWVTADGTANGFVNVSNTATESNNPRLALGNETPEQRPHIVWQENTAASTASGEEIFYRWWDGSGWVDADPADGPDDDVSANIDSNSWGIGIPNPEGADPKIALTSDNRPGLLWRDPGRLIFLQWDTAAKDWVDANPVDGQFDDIWPNRPAVGEPEMTVHASHSMDLTFDDQDRPHVVWGDDLAWRGIADVRYRYWSPLSSGGSGAWVTASGDSGGLLNYDDLYLTVDASSDWHSRLNSVKLDALGNPHIIWIDTQVDPVAFAGGLQCGAFDGDGIVEVASTSSANDVALETDYMYTIGSNDDATWHIEKRRSADGELCAAGVCSAGTFGIGGVVNGPAGGNGARRIAIDSTYMYVFGATTPPSNWRIEKRLLSDGSLYASFGTGGTVTSVDGMNAGGIAIDGSYMYISGKDDSNNWRIEKRRLSDGSLVDSFGTAGIITGASDSNKAQDIVIDDNYLYVAGFNDSNKGRIEKRSLDTGALCTAGTCSDGDFGDAGSGIITVAGTNVTLYSIKIDSEYMYIGGTVANDWHIEKRRLDTGALCTAGACPAGDFGTGGVIAGQSATLILGELDIDQEYIYIAGNDEFEEDLRIEKYNINTGALCTAGACPAGDFGDAGSGVVTGAAASKYVNGMAIDTAYMYIVGSGDDGNWRTEKRWLTTGALDNFGSSLDCTNPQYPYCITYSWPSSAEKYCVASDLKYNRWTPGKFKSGLGWLEVMPVGALIGIPWVNTMYSDIYAQENIQLAPPPRGSEDFTSTYLILADGSIQGIPSYYSQTQTGLPTSGFYQQGLDSLIGGKCSLPAYVSEISCADHGGSWTAGAGFPLGQNVLETLDIDGLVANTGGLNRNGNRVQTQVDASGSVVDISNCSITHGSMALDGQIYHFSGADHYVINNEMTFENGFNGTSGNGLIVIDGDLEINDNTYYNSGTLDSISEMASAAVIVRGNIYINSTVDQLAGVFVAIDPDTTDDVVKGVISTGRRLPVSQTVQAGVDDAYVSKAGAVYNNVNDGDSLKFGLDAGVTYRSYLRWGFGTGGLNIPPNSEIKSAKIKLTGDNAVAGDFIGRIYLANYNDIYAFNHTVPPPSFQNPNAQNLYDIPTSNSVSYDVTDWVDNGENITPDIKSLVQKYINSDEYEKTYYDNATSYMGVVLKEGDASGDEYRSFSSVEDGSPAELIIEFSPQQVNYDITDLGNDTAALPGSYDQGAACMNIGWNAGSAERTYLRFKGINLPANVEILDAHLRASVCDSGGVGFQTRQGLVRDYPDFSSNPYGALMTDDVSETAQNISDTEWTTDETVYLRDITTLVESFIGRGDYQPGVSGKSEMVLRLRRGNDTVETTAGDGEYRGLKEGTGNLVVNYRLPLQVSGLFVAKGYSFDRKYSKDLAPSEQIVYDGRVVANTPPGLSDFTKALPVYQQVIP